MKKLKYFFPILTLTMAISSFEAIAKTELQDALPKKYQAPEISGVEKWLNGAPLKISELKGKVVLVDFWTYSCINCLRTLPYMNELQRKYADKGLVIIGVHSPEFDFEKNAQNVESAIKRFSISYPVALDNDLKTWNSFQNRHWPAHYLINKEGKVVYEHFGEGAYDVIENNIATLLGVEVAAVAKNAKTEFYNANVTHETYLGSARSTNNFNHTGDNFTFPKTLPTNGWALQGAWKITPNFIESQKSGDSLRLNFVAKKVFLVMASATGKPVGAKILLNGKVDSMGLDAKDGKVTVQESRLYELLNLPKNSGSLLEIKADTAGLQAYVFTFGGS